MTRLVDALVGLAIRFQEWRTPRVLSPEELHRQRIAEQERARTQYQIDRRESELNASIARHPAGKKRRLDT